MLVAPQKARPASLSMRAVDPDQDVAKRLGTDSEVGGQSRPATRPDRSQRGPHSRLHRGDTDLRCDGRRAAKRRCEAAVLRTAIFPSIPAKGVVVMTWGPDDWIPTAPAVFAGAEPSRRLARHRPRQDFRPAPKCSFIAQAAPRRWKPSLPKSVTPTAAPM
jgi:hypothetical protein